MRPAKHPRLIGWILASLMMAVGWAQNAVPATPLLALLAYVPQAAVSEESGWASVRYVDYAAWAEVEGIAPLRGLGDVGLSLLMTGVPLGPMLGRIAAGPSALSYVLSSAGRMAEAVGFEWLIDVDRSLDFGDPPNVGLLLRGRLDAASIGAALEERGFARTDLDGVAIWHRFEDYAVSLAHRDLADPFDGYLGAAARVACLPDVVAHTRSWPLFEAILGAGWGHQASLADDPRYRALADAVAAEDGQLLQALYFPAAAFRLGTSAENTDPLPPYTLAILADSQEGADQVHRIGLVVADRAAALTAAAVLAERIRAFHLPDRPNDVLVARFAAVVSSSVLECPKDSLAVACVEARYPSPSPRVDEETGLFRSGGGLYRAWVQAIQRREFTPLW